MNKPLRDMVRSGMSQLQEINLQVIDYIDENKLGLNPNIQEYLLTGTKFVHSMQQAGMTQLERLANATDKAVNRFYDTK